jgi:hypothetical protein
VCPLCVILCMYYILVSRIQVLDIWRVIPMNDSLETQESC